MQAVEHAEDIGAIVEVRVVELDEGETLMPFAQQRLAPLWAEGKPVYATDQDSD